MSDSDGSNSAVQDPPKTEVPPTEAPKGGTKAAPKPSPPKMDRLPPFHVLLHNDDVNDMFFVAMTICDLTKHTWDRAVDLMMTAHKRGMVVVMTTHKEHAELVRDRFRSKGLRSSIEPAPQA